ncbi:hypothetical protein VP01_393g1 [Puccinia sorghi]|uniref:Uncharacterized protein n=1 Tax=Puccinia sorghi TaxID=27349 RepID=A0A0L6USF7_9BASI|nr:hypothetical protein VP01_393g1 [Puccinia sorghi]
MGERERGWFPSNYTRRLTDEEADLTRAQLETFKQTSDSAINKIHHPVENNADHTSRMSVISIHYNNNSNNQWDDQQELNHPPMSSFESNATQPLPLSTNTQNSHNRLPTSTPNQSNSWAAWLPKVTDDGQIYYHNNLTGEIASEMPLADYDLELESHPTTTTHGSNQPRLISEFHLEDPLKFLQDNGFSKETLIQRGLLSSSQFSPTTLFATNQTPACSNISPSSASAQTSTNLHSPSITQSQSNSNNNSELRLSNPPQSSPNDPINPQHHTNPPSDLITSELTSDPPHHPLNLNRSSASSSNVLSIASSSRGIGTSKNIFQFSQQLKEKLQPVVEVPATLTFSQMATEITEAISFCQLDTAVLSMLNDSGLAVNFSSLSIGQARSSSIPPISPYVSSRDSTFSSNSSFQSLFTNAHLNFPGLKLVSRKIASTLSKLTLSTRALWGLLSIESGDLFEINDKNSFTPLDLQELHSRQNAQSRFALEQKLRSECRMGCRW